MKHVKFLILIFGLFLFISCQESVIDDETLIDKNQAVFSGIIGELETRVSGTNWDNADAIGISALLANHNEVFADNLNVEYVTSGNGNFTAVTRPKAIKFPLESNLDFVAYYPYSNDMTSLEYTVEAGSDPLFSNNAKSQNNENPNVSLDFKHILSKVVVNIEVGDFLSSLEGLKATVNNVYLDGQFNLVTNEVILGKSKSVDVDISFDKSVEGFLSATLTFLIMPDQNIKDLEVVFLLGENRYNWSASSSMITASSLEYVYNVKLNAKPEPLAVEIGSAKISEWGKGYHSTSFDVLDPENEVETVEFTTDVTKIQFDPNYQLSREIQLTTATTQSWTVTKNANWFNVNPGVGGTGSKNITITATKNSELSEREAKVAIIPKDNEDLSPIIITVIQSGEKVSGKNDGTKERPYSVADVVLNQGDKGNKDYVWVKAYIVGTVSSGLSLEGAVETNLLIADDINESDIINAVAAQLPDNKVRNNLNLKYNPDMFKAQVLLYGTLEDYFKAPGLKNIKEYEVISTNQ